MKQEFCKLRYINTVNVPLQSMANGFQSEVGFAHAAGVLFFNFKFMFLTYGMGVRHDISKQGIYAFFRTRKKGNMRWVIYKSSLS